MSKQCERPSCREIAVASYVLDSSELVMRLENFVPIDGLHVNVLCRRHADALVVPRGWNIEDKRENVPRLFPVTSSIAVPKAQSDKQKSVAAKVKRVKPPRPSIFDELRAEKPAAIADLEETKAIPWSPEFDHTDDLGGVLRPKGRLLSRAFNFDDTSAGGLKREPFDEHDIP